MDSRSIDDAPGVEREELASNTNNMLSRSLFSKPLDHPRETLITVFIAWKCLLLLIAASSPGPGYDTSTELAQPYDRTAEQNHVVTLLRLLSTKLTRWDAIYFTRIASRDYLYEQDWAFGWGFTRLIKFFANDLKERGFQEYEFLESFVGIGLAHVAHGLSAFTLYSLTLAIFHDGQNRRLAFVTACLHIFSPAGLFLSAPYGESVFSFLNFSGYLLFVKSFSFRELITPHQDILIAASGIVLGFAATVRGNGLLNGVLFLEEAIRIIHSLKNGLAVPVIRRLIATGIGGVCIATGFLLPQFIAFQEFCGDFAVENRPQRIWCEATLPSIYGFVQSHYWNVGFLRYWTISNIPLFVLAFPMLTIMMISCSWAMRDSSNRASESLKPTTGRLTSIERRLLRSLAAPQLVLAILALTSYHVQIITRISSGYCIWYFWLARSVITSTEKSPKLKGDKSSSWKLGGSTEMVVYIVVYAAVQAGLFSSFLPPA